MAIGVVNAKTPGKNAEEQLRDLRARTAVPHEQRCQTDKLRNEENEGKNDKPKERMTKDFTDNVAVQDAHDEER
jgi:hypothetical protein